MNFLEVLNGSHNSGSEELASLRNIALMAVMEQGLVPTHVHITYTVHVAHFFIKTDTLYMFALLLGGFLSSLLNLFHQGLQT